MDEFGRSQEVERVEKRSLSDPDVSHVMCDALIDGLCDWVDAAVEDSWCFGPADFLAVRVVEAVVTNDMQDWIHEDPSTSHAVVEGVE